MAEAMEKKWGRRNGVRRNVEEMGSDSINFDHISVIVTISVRC